MKKSTRAWNNKGHETACKQCGVVFESSPSAERIYCSKGCADAAKLGTIPHNRQEGAHIVCAECGEPFRVPENRRATARFCSHACGSSHKKRATGEKHPLWKPKPIRECRWCHKTFEIKACYASGKNNRGRYCSSRCRAFASAAGQGGRQSSIERAVLAELERRGVPHEPQKRMALFLVDVYIPSRKLVIECDGTYWHSLAHIREKDKNKDRWLRSHGQTIVRLTEVEINRDVVAAVDRALAAAPGP